MPAAGFQVVGRRRTLATVLGSGKSAAGKSVAPDAGHVENARPGSGPAMDILLSLLHVAAFVMVALALVLPPLRLWAISVLALAGLLGVVHGGVNDAPHTLTTNHSFAGYAGADLEVSMVAFPTGQFTAPGWQWPLVFVCFAAFWIVVLAVLGRRQIRNALVLPLLLAWTAMAAWLGMQWFAAPAAIVQPIGLDRFLWPAGLAAALLAARTAQKFVPLFVTVGGAILLARLPAALFSKYASDGKLGTCLDISSITNIVNPMNQTQFEPMLQPGSGQQQFWLIWLEHVIFFPAVYLMSLFGVAFCAWMFHRHPDSAVDARADSGE